MNAQISIMTLDLNNVTPRTDNIGRSYSFMEGNSPYFRNDDDLIAYYKDLPQHKRKKHISFVNNKPYLFIYSHDVALIDHTTEIGYNAVKGEVLSTDECYIYSFTAKCWNGHPNFDL